MNTRFDERADVQKNLSEFLPNVEKSSLFLDDVIVNEILETISDLYNEEDSDTPAVVITHRNAVISPVSCSGRTFQLSIT